MNFTEGLLPLFCLGGVYFLVICLLQILESFDTHKSSVEMSDLNHQSIIKYFEWKASTLSANSNIQGEY